MKNNLFIAIVLTFLFLSCQTDEMTASTEEETNEQNAVIEEESNPDSDLEPIEETDATDQTTIFTDSFEGNGDLIDYVTNNASALPNTTRKDDRYHAELIDNQNNVTLHFNNRQGRLDAKLLTFPFEFIARNIGIGTLQDSQSAPSSESNPYIFAGVQVHVENFNSINSSHVVVGHRGGTGFTIEGKNTVNGASSVNDIGSNTAPQGRADIRIVGTQDRTLAVYWQLPNTDFETVEDNWSFYRTNGMLPGSAPTYAENVYVGLITYASGSNGVPFVGTCDAIQIK